MLFDRIIPFLKIMQKVQTSEWAIEEYLKRIVTIKEVTVLDMVYEQIEQEILTSLELKDTEDISKVKEILKDMRANWLSIKQLELLLKNIESRI